MLFDITLLAAAVLAAMSAISKIALEASDIDEQPRLKRALEWLAVIPAVLAIFCALISATIAIYPNADWVPLVVICVLIGWLIFIGVFMNKVKARPTNSTPTTTVNS